MIDSFSQTSRNQIRRKPDRGHYDRVTVYQIIDEALVCQVAFVEDGQPYVIPTLHGRFEDKLFLHGANASRMLKHISAGHPICVSVTILDGIVFARSAFEHSVNYRSVVLYGKGRLVVDSVEKLHALEVLTNHIAQGRWDDVRPPTPQELSATTVVEIAIESASAKIRNQMPTDFDEDYHLPVWAGILPLELKPQDPIDDGRLLPGVTIPGYIASYLRK